MNEELMFKEVKELTLCCGKSIDKIAHDTGVNQNLVAKLFMKVMQNVLDKVEETNEINN